LIIRPAVREDHSALETLVRETVMDGTVQLVFERDPDFFAGSLVQSDEPCMWAAFEDSGRAVGMFGAGVRRVWLDGKTRMRYLSDMRIHPNFRNSSLMGRGFRALGSNVFQPGEWAQTLVLESNRAAMEILTSGRGGLPRYHPAGRYVNWLLPGQKTGGPASCHVRRAGAEDVPEMQSLLDDSARRRSFSHLLSLHDPGKPVWRDLHIGDFLVAEKAGRMAGMMGLWDQSGFQRMRVAGYSRVLSVLRPCWNAFSNVKLPRVGTTLPIIKTTAIACRDDDSQVLRAMLSVALGESGDRLLMVGMSAVDPLIEGLRGLKGRRDFGRHFLVGWEGEPPRWKEPFSFDAARI